MKLEHQVCTLERAKKLAGIFKAAGVEPPESLWCWQVRKRGTNIVPSEEANWPPVGVEKITHCNAYTGTELGVLLGLWNCHSPESVNEAKYRADTLIHILDQKLIKPEEISYDQHP